MHHGKRLQDMAQPEGLVDADATLVEEDAAEEQADVELCFRFAA